MRLLLKYIVTVAITVAMIACSDDDHFRINGKIDGEPTMNLRIVYHDGTALRTAVIASREGDFEYFGSAPAGAVAEIYDYEGHLIARTYVANGQNTDLRLSGTDRFGIEASGNRQAAQWAAALQANAEALRAGGATANAAIARYVGEHPGEMTSTLLLAYDYDVGADPAGADSLLQIISPQARPGRYTQNLDYHFQRLLAPTATDSLPSIPYRRRDGRPDTLAAGTPALLAFTAGSAADRDSIRPTLRRLAHAHRVLEISNDPDTNSWRRHTAPDSGAWTQTWFAAGFAHPTLAPLGIPGVPFFIVTDSAGRAVYRGPSVSLAARALEK